MALSSVRGAARVLTLVLGPCLDCVVRPLDDDVVLPDGVVRDLPRPGGLPQGRPLRFTVLGCLEFWFKF